MTGILTAAGYNQTKDKLAKLEQRLVNLSLRSDLNQQHLAAAQRSCKKMIAQYLRELKLYEAAHPEASAKS
jgi:hypothetical protein